VGNRLIAVEEKKDASRVSQSMRGRKRLKSKSDGERTVAEPQQARGTPKAFFLKKTPKNKKTKNKKQKNLFTYPFHGTPNITSTTISSQHTVFTLQSSIRLSSKAG
jgi:hypothetical protein